MNLLNTTLIGLALSADCFAVSISGGIKLKKPKISDILKIGIFFGGFQFFMTFAGYYFGTYFTKYIESYDHFIAFGLLSFIGGKMIFEAFQDEEDEEFSLSYKTLTILAIATSMDALGVGLSFALLNDGILIPSIIIGIISFIVAIVGISAGKILGEKIGKKAEIIGGLILIGIGVKIIVEHLEILS